MYEIIEKRILDRLDKDFSELQNQWNQSEPVKTFIIDDLLESTWVEQAAADFPEFDRLNRFDSIRERKSSSADMSEWGETTRNVFLALQSPSVLQRISQITGIKNLEGDTSGYAGGISAMKRGDFLNPHLDNSTHPRIKGYRRLNALFYITQNWPADNGGNLELWSKDLKERRELHSKFNRLLVMNTNRESLHSVNTIKNTDDIRRCISNYYFNGEAPDEKDYSHITSFRGRPGEFIKDAYLRTEGVIGSFIQSIVGKPIKDGAKGKKRRD